MDKLFFAYIITSGHGMGVYSIKNAIDVIAYISSFKVGDTLRIKNFYDLRITDFEVKTNFYQGMEAKTLYIKTNKAIKI